MDSTEIYDPVTDEFSSGPPLAVARANAVTAPLPDGRAMVIGGTRLSHWIREELNSTEIYDPVAESFEPGPTTPFTEVVSGAALANGRILITTESTFWEYDPSTETFIDSEVSATPYLHSATAALPGARALLAGPSAHEFGSEGKLAWIYHSAPLATGQGIDLLRDRR